MRKVEAARTMVYLLPSQSEVLPEAKDPIRDTTFKDPTNISTCVDEIFRSSLMNNTAPLITPMSAKKLQPKMVNYLIETLKNLSF